MRHEWTDPEDLILYRVEPDAIRRPLSREAWDGGVIYVLAREILRLAEEVERLKAENHGLRLDMDTQDEQEFAKALDDERDRLRPLLERCLKYATGEDPYHGDALRADLRRELGRD